MPLQATLEGWIHHLRVSTWDRAGAIGGRYFDRGVFRYRTPRMDHEYDIDQFTVAYTPADDAAFYSHETGLRSQAVSVTTSDFITRTELRARAPLGDLINLRIATDLQDDFEAKRWFLHLGYEVPIGDEHTVGFMHSLFRSKPDIDLGFYYEHRRENGFLARVEATALDGLNNIIGSLKHSPSNRDTLRTYRKAPFMVSGFVSSPIIPRIRGEAAFGVQTHAVADITSLNHEDLRFTFEDSFWYLGALLEGEVIPGMLTVGSLAKFTSSSMSRFADITARDPAEYTTSQPYSRIGGYGLVRNEPFHGEAWVYFDHYRDEQEGVQFGGATVDGPYLFEESRTWIRAEAGMLTPIDLDVSLSYQGDLRSYPRGEGLDDSYYLYPPRRPSHRLTLNLSYAFSASTSLDGGVSYDLDNDHFFVCPCARSRYDGTYLRLRAHW